ISIKSLGRISRRSLLATSANSKRLAYVSHPGRELYLKSNPYSLAASRVTFGFKNICVSGLAINPNTVTTGQVKTRVCRVPQVPILGPGKPRTPTPTRSSLRSNRRYSPFPPLATRKIRELNRRAAVGNSRRAEWRDSGPGGCVVDVHVRRQPLAAALQQAVEHDVIHPAVTADL